MSKRVQMAVNAAADPARKLPARQIAAAIAVAHAIDELARQIGRLVDLADRRSP